MDDFWGENLSTSYVLRTSIRKLETAFEVPSSIEIPRGIYRRNPKYDPLSCLQEVRSISYTNNYILIYACSKYFVHTLLRTWQFSIILRTYYVRSWKYFDHIKSRRTIMDY